MDTWVLGPWAAGGPAVRPRAGCCPPAGRGEHTPRAGVPEGGGRVPFPLYHHGECGARGPRSALSPGSRVWAFSLGLGRGERCGSHGPRAGHGAEPQGRTGRRSRRARARPRPCPLPPGRQGFRFRASGMGPACGPGPQNHSPGPAPAVGRGHLGNRTWGKGSCPHTWLGSGCRWVAGSPGHAGWEHACPVAQSAHTCGRGGHVWAGRTHAGRGGAGVWMPQTPSHIHCALCSPTNSDDPD